MAIGELMNGESPKDLLPDELPRIAWRES